MRTSFPSSVFLGILPLSDRHSRHKIRPFWKGRTHLPVRPYIAIIIPRSWRLRASFAVSNPCIPLTARRCFPRCRYVPTLQSLSSVVFAPSPAVCRLASSRIFQINVKPNLQNGRFCCIFVLQGRNIGMAPRIFRLFSCLLPISARTERIFSTAVQDFLSAVPFFRSLRFERLGRFCFDGIK